VNLKNKFYVIGALVFVFCGRAVALPQDWPCFEFELEKKNVIQDTDDDFEYTYSGETKGFVVDINLFGSHKFPQTFARCGTSGCQGIITEKNTGKTENLRFFCEKHNEGFTKVSCFVGLGDEAVFDEESENNYALHYCPDDMEKTLKFSVHDCKKCHCEMHWHNGENKDETGIWAMSCRKEGKKAHCFTYYGYENWRNFENEQNDFDECVKLGL